LPFALVLICPTVFGSGVPFNCCVCGVTVFGNGGACGVNFACCGGGLNLGCWGGGLNLGWGGGGLFRGCAGGVFCRGCCVGAGRDGCLSFCASAVFVFNASTTATIAVKLRYIWLPLCAFMSCTILRPTVCRWIVEFKKRMPRQFLLRFHFDGSGKNVKNLMRSAVMSNLPADAVKMPANLALLTETQKWATRIAITQPQSPRVRPFGFGEQGIRTSEGVILQY